MNVLTTEITHNVCQYFWLDSHYSKLYSFINCILFLDTFFLMINICIHCFQTEQNTTLTLLLGIQLMSVSNLHKTEQACESIYG